LIVAALERERPNAAYQLEHLPPVRSAGGWPDLGGLKTFLFGLPDERSLAIAITLNDGSRLDLDLRIPPPFSLWSPGFALSMGLMALVVIFFAYGAARWIIAPLATFTRAAEKLGRDVKAPPLAVDGLTEMRGAAEAFNAMQQSIQRFLDDRTQMMAAIAHDLRTPITRMRLRSEMLPSNAIHKRMVRDLDEMEAMVTACLQFMRDDFAEEKSEPIDLAALLETICDEACGPAGRAEFAWTGSNAYICRPLALKRAFANLVGNAVKYGHRAAVAMTCGADGITVVIDDAGPGIPPQEMEAVFTPFYRIETSRNRSTGGIGLGLSVARGIIRAHGGDVRLANRTGGGLRVIATLPRSAEELAA
jgi:signal transduction histidine kinase